MYILVSSVCTLLAFYVISFSSIIAYSDLKSINLIEVLLVPRTYLPL